MFWCFFLKSCASMSIGIRGIIRKFTNSLHVVQNYQVKKLITRIPALLVKKTSFIDQTPCAKIDTLALDST